MHRHDVQPQLCSASRLRAVLGFTLAEMVVAIGAVALLTIGIGQIFGSVGALVSTGAALAETDQAARAIEDQLREDFASFNAMRANETFLMIRNRRIRRVYLSPEIRDEDQRAGIPPSSPDSLTISSRLDEIMFLGLGSGNDGLFSSAQFAEPRPGRQASAQVARIYYGHGLRPSPEIGFDPDEVITTGNAPGRKWIPDGDFGQRRGQNNRFDSGADSLVAGRNQFASDWLLLRQSLLLMGSEIAVEPQPGQKSPLDPVMTFAPYIRPAEAEIRSATIWPNIDSQNAQQWPGVTSSPFDESLKPRFMPFGRTDLCAQSPEEVQRWLEGVHDDGDPSTPLIDATPFDSRPFPNDRPPAFFQSPALDNLTFPSASPDSALWTRFKAGPSPTEIFNTNRANLKSYQSAFAGMFTRLQAESDPPFVDRQDSLGFGSNDPVPVQGDDPSSAFMDLHATLGTRCSRFEVAWSDGTTWPISEPKYIHPTNSDIIFSPGDLVWFDIEFPRFNPDSNIDLEDVITTVNIPPADPIRNPEINFKEREDRLWIETNNFGPYVIANFGNTDAMFTGAVVDADRDNKEYLALWGYHQLDPGGSGEYIDSPWITPESLRLIRIRMTIHDSQLRLDGGRTYEFVFPVNPRR